MSNQKTKLLYIKECKKSGGLLVSEIKCKKEDMCEKIAIENKRYSSLKSLNLVLENKLSSR